MKKIFMTLFYIIRNFFIKVMIADIKNRRVPLFIMEVTGILFALNIIMLLPVLIGAFSPWLMLYCGLLLIASLALSITFYAVEHRQMEKINNELLGFNLILSDFRKFISNDSIYCGITGFIIVFSLFLYQLILILLSLIFARMSLTFLLNVLFISFAAVLMLTFGGLYFNYAFSKKNKNMMIKFEEYEDARQSGIFMTAVYFIFLYILQIFILKHFIKFGFMCFMYPIPTSVLLAIGLNSLLQLTGIYNHFSFTKLSVAFGIFLRDVADSFREKKFKKLLIYVKYIIPIAAFVLCHIILSVCYKQFSGVSGLKFWQSLLFCCISFVLLRHKKSSRTKQIREAVNFAFFMFAILFVISFAGLHEIQTDEAETDITVTTQGSGQAVVKTKQADNQFEIKTLFSFFVTPLIDLHNKTYSLIRTNLDERLIPMIILTPIIFAMLVFLSLLVILIVDKLRFTIYNILKSKLIRQDENILFGDSVSFFYFLLSLLINLPVMLLLKLECPALANFFNYIFDTFQVASIFKMKFLTAENVTAAVNLIINIIIVIIALRLLFQFISSMLSYFILFADEIVWIENKLYTGITLRIPLSKVNYIICRQNIVEKLFDIGSILIEAQDKNGLIKINGVSSIKQKNIILMEKIKIDLQKV